MSAESTSTGRLVLLLAVFVVVGAPMAAHIWHVLSDVLVGRVETVPVISALALIVVFLGLLRLLVGILPGAPLPTEEEVADGGRDPDAGAVRG